jgi:malate permease and related proteins
MPEVYKELVPVFLMIFLGILLKYFKILTSENAHLLLQVVFYISLPSLILANIPNAVLEPDFIYLPVIPLFIGVILFYISRKIGGLLKLDRKTFGVFVISSLIINTAFAFPFVAAMYGNEGLSRILIIDIGNAVFIYGFAYYQACKYGNQEVNRKLVVKRLSLSIPLWSIGIALALNLLNIGTTGTLHEFFKMAGSLTIPLLLLSVGAFFELKILKFKALSMAIIIRMGMGLILGWVLADLLDLEGITRNVVILATASPVGYNTLIFSSLEKLDTEFAASLVSISILIAIIYIPAIYFLFF